MLPFVLLRRKMDVSYCYITEAYYIDHPNLKQILDIADHSKHNIRTHICLNISINGNNILVPLRKSLGDADRSFGKIGFSVPSDSKPKAGLDYRYIMIINNKKYIRLDNPRIPTSQQKIIQSNYSQIEKEVLEYVETYKRVAKKKRVQKTARFRASSLINFHTELGLDVYEESPFKKTNNKSQEQ